MGTTGAPRSGRRIPGDHPLGEVTAADQPVGHRVGAVGDVPHPHADPDLVGPVEAAAPRGEDDDVAAPPEVGAVAAADRAVTDELPVTHPPHHEVAAAE